MRSLIPQLSRGDRADPAPSRLAYRLNRLLLTPLFHRSLRIGLPLCILAISVAVVALSPERRETVALWVEDVKLSVQQRPEFMVKLMAIDGASDRVADAIREIVPVHFPVSSFDLDLPAMQRTIAGLDAVARADLRIRPGGILQVRVSERMPVVVWRQRGRIEMLDVTGQRVATLDARTDRPDLPLIAGRGAQQLVDEALELVAAARPLDDRLRGLVRVGERRWDVMLEDDRRILLPEVSPVRALEQVLALHQAQEILDRDVELVDMRNPRRPTVRLAQAAAENLRRIKQIEMGVRTE